MVIARIIIQRYGQYKNNKKYSGLKEKNNIDKKEFNENHKRLKEKLESLDKKESAGSQYFQLSRDNIYNKGD